MGVLDRILGALTGGGAAAATANAAGITREQADWLAKSLQPLETMDKALPDHAFAYVVEGSHETVLLALQQAAGKSPEALLGKPGRLRWRFHVWNDKTLSAETEPEQAWKVTADNIKARGYNLDIKNPHTVADDHGDPEELLAQLDTAEMETTRLRDRLKAILAEALAR